MKDYYKTTRFAQCLLVLNSASKIGQAIALGLLMEQFTIVPTNSGDADGAAALFEANRTSASSSSRTKEGYIWCIVLIACGLITFPTKQRLYFELYRKGMQIRVGLVATLYDKALRLCSTSSSSSSSHNGESSSSSSAGKLTNLASNDVERFVLASIPSLYLVVGPVEAVVILVIGVNILGPVSLCSICEYAFVYNMFGCFLKRFVNLLLLNKCSLQTYIINCANAHERYLQLATPSSSCWYLFNSIWEDGL